MNKFFKEQQIFLLMHGYLLQRQNQRNIRDVFFFNCVAIGISESIKFTVLWETIPIFTSLIKLYILIFLNSITIFQYGC